MNKYRADIDGLRAIAVLSVLFFHLKIAIFGGGFLGVDVFFVISGFLITGHMANEIQSSGSISFLDFYARRFKRLLPALLVFLFIILILWIIYFFSLDSETDKFLTSMKYGLFGVANFFFKKNIGNYFDSSSDKMPLLHLWSLGVEEQFYFVWPLIFFVVFRYNSGNFINRILKTIVFLTLVSFGSSLWQIYTGNQIRSFYTMHLRMWEIGIGAIGALLSFNGHQEKINLKIKNLLTLIGGFTVIISILIFKENKFFPGWRTLIVCVGTFLILFYNEKETLLYKILSNKILVFIGLISYSLYLYHWPIISFLHIYNLKSEISILQKVYIFCGVMVVSIASYYLVESKIKKSLYIRQMTSRSVIVVSISMLVLFFISIHAVGKIHKNKISKIPFYSQIKERIDLSEKCRGSVPDFDFRNCFVNPKKSDGQLLQDTNLIFMWGDSFTYATGNLLDNLIKNSPNTQLVMFSSFSRPPILNLDYLWIDNENWAKETAKINQVVLNQIEQMVKMSKSVSIVMEVRWTKYISSLDENKTELGSVLEFETKLNSTITTLSKMGVNKILLNLPYPEYGFDISECTRLRDVNECYIDEVQFKNKFNAVYKVLESLEKKYTYIKLINPFEVVCQNGKCPSIIKDKENGEYPASWDDCHPTSIATKKLSIHFQDDLTWLVTNKLKK